MGIEQEEFGKFLSDLSKSGKSLAEVKVSIAEYEQHQHRKISRLQFNMDEKTLYSRREID